MKLKGKSIKEQEKLIARTLKNKTKQIKNLLMLI